MTAPATILLAKMLIPESGEPETRGTIRVEIEKPGVNVIDAAARGAADGLRLAANVGGMLIAFLALIALLNGIFGWAHSHAGWFPESMQQFLGWIMAPIAWLIGVPWKDAAAVGNMMGTRFILNEFVAFSQLGPMRDSLDPKSFTIATYALCGFANLSSIAIQVGGIGALAPERRSDLARLGLRAVIAGTLANFMSAAIVGMMV
jgi:CNT family concentrative nucleoside transporter